MNLDYEVAFRDALWNHERNSRFDEDEARRLPRAQNESPRSFSAVWRRRRAKEE